MNGCSPRFQIVRGWNRRTRYDSKGNHTGANFGWHISNLRIYDTPRELREFYAVPNEVEVALKAKPKPITRPPQSWRYVEEEL